ncbi:restriction endonuclease subunit S [Pseudoalteromonas sp. BSi20429]|uniref:restriction endonuclease subunit S n=1 Tax=Pseudoalteromonas sp. BSi20429 TaxID=1097676 RepID=UPI0002316CE0|nr:restriction endonuclease subunit S [Pseudoalteromonas sp. BSi20429]GAA69182.1 type I restriction enzyme, S subunit [Pseudoalteromonas sp. BSi20429]
MNNEAITIQKCVEEYANSESLKRKKQKEKVFKKGILWDFSDQITSGWYIADLFDVTNLITCGVAKRPEYVEEGIPFLSAQNARPFKTNLNKIRYIDENTFKKITVGGKPEKGDILYTRVGNCGEAATVPYDFDFGVYVSLTLIKPNNLFLYSDYLTAFLNSHFGVMQASQGAIGVGLKNLNVDNVRRYKIPLPPLPEQKRIVEKLDSLLAQVDTIQQRLNNLPDIIKRFRQSVLAAAFSGKLTEQWRGDNDCDALADLKIELAKKDQNPKKIEPTSNHEIVTDQFPSCWGISSFDSMYRFIDYRGRTPKKSEQGKRLITAKNIKMGFLSDEPVEYLSDEDYINWMTRGFPKLNDLFFVTEGHTMGCVALNTRTDEFALAQRTITLQPYGTLLTKFHYYYILTNSFQRLIETNATGSAAKGIKAAKFRGFPLPFPSYNEQTEIVRLVEQYFALADTLEKNLANAKQRVDSLTQSILAKAFRGELVPQDPSDEPADKLLARIKAARLEAENLEKAAKKAAKASKK